MAEQHGLPNIRLLKEARKDHRSLVMHIRNPARLLEQTGTAVTVPRIDEYLQAGCSSQDTSADGAPAPRPNTLISVSEPGEPYRGTANVLITQVGPAAVEVRVDDEIHTVEVELFRAENRYVSSEPTVLRSSELEAVDTQ